MVHFDIDYSDTPFLETSQTNASLNRLNWRCEVLLTRNRRAIEGRRVLDLASHDGRFSYACLRLGAAAVTGVEGRSHLVENANRTFAALGFARERFRFLHGDLFAHLRSFAVGEFDTILCFGFFYHTVRHIELLEEVRRLAPRFFLLDTQVHRERTAIQLLRGAKRLRPRHLLPRNLRELAESLDGELMAFKHENPEEEGLTIDPSGYVGVPTRTLVTKLLALTGFRAVELRWAEERDWRALLDYRRRVRVSFLCEEP